MQFAGKSSSFDNRLFASDDFCHATREINAEKAKHLVHALAVAGVKKLAVQNLSCRSVEEGLVGADEPETECHPVAKNLAQAELLIEALGFIGIWMEGGMSHSYFSADSIRCTVNNEKTNYKCTITADWAWGCP